MPMSDEQIRTHLNAQLELARGGIPGAELFLNRKERNVRIALDFLEEAYVLCGSLKDNYLFVMNQLNGPTTFGDQLGVIRTGIETKVIEIDRSGDIIPDKHSEFVTGIREMYDIHDLVRSGSL